MGLFRTIPHDVQAVQFAGMKGEEPDFSEMGSSLPSWLWRGITKGAITFGDKGVSVHGETLKPGDWIVFDAPFYAAVENEKFHETFTRAIKPLGQMKSAPKSLAAQRSMQAGVVAPDPSPEGDVNEERIVQSEETIPDASPDEMSAPETDQVPTKIDEADAILEKLMSNAV